MSRTALLATAAAGILLAFVLVLTVMRGATGPQDDPFGGALRGGVLRIGYAVEAPHAFLKPGGQVTGQSPETARLVADRLGIARVEWRMAEFGALLDELEQGRIDVIAAGMFITPERAQRANFSEPIFHVSQGLLVAAGNPHKLGSYQDALGKPRVRVAVLSGAVEELLLRRIGLPGTQLVPVPDAQTGRVAVETGMADALALSSPTIEWMIRHDQLGRTEKARPFEQPDPKLMRRAGYGAFAFRKKDAKLLGAWNAAQKQVLASAAYAALMQEFGFTPEDYPGALSAKEILAP
ncbi:transporter substrate-binding domain-containing protein [Humidesulfovibrio idahonensis]